MLTDDPANGVPGLTDDPAVADALLVTALDRARQVGGVGRVLLFDPPAAESRLAARALGFRLWPQEGQTAGERFANSFRQAADLGYEGAVVFRLPMASAPSDLLAQAVALLDEHPGAVVPDGQGGIGLLALQEPQPTLFSGAAVPSYQDLTTRAAQQRVRLVELPEQPALTPDTLDDFLAGARSR